VRHRSHRTARPANTEINYPGGRSVSGLGARHVSRYVAARINRKDVKVGRYDRYILVVYTDEAYLAGATSKTS
jgi:hypothetical protein